MTPFWHLGLRLWEVGVEFTKLAAKVAGILILGPVLAVPFLVIAGIFFRLADVGWEADELIVDLQHFVYWLRYQGGVNDLIRSVFWAWDRFRSDPYGFVNDAVTHYFPWWGSFRNDPWGFVNDRIADRFGEWNWFRSDPPGWLRYQIEQRLGLGSGFFADPTGWIRERLYNRYPLLRGFFESPTQWIRTIVGLHFGIGTEFFDDPTRWVWDQVMLATERYIDTNTVWLGRIVARALNAIWTAKL